MIFSFAYRNVDPRVILSSLSSIKSAKQLMVFGVISKDCISWKRPRHFQVSTCLNSLYSPHLQLSIPALICDSNDAPPVVHLGQNRWCQTLLSKCWFSWWATADGRNLIQHLVYSDHFNYWKLQLVWLFQYISICFNHFQAFFHFFPSLYLRQGTKSRFPFTASLARTDGGTEALGATHVRGWGLWNFHKLRKQFPKIQDI